MTNISIREYKIKTISYFFKGEHNEEISNKVLSIIDNYELEYTVNNNGIFINLTNVSKDIIEDIINYLKYVDTQEKLLNDIEDQKETLTNTFFKDNKDNTYISINE